MSKSFLLEWWGSNDGGNLEKKHGRSKEQYGEVNSLLWEWYQCCRVSNITVSGPVLQEEVLSIAGRLGKKEFKAPNGWLERWKNQHNIAQRNAAVEEGDVSDNTVCTCSCMERVKKRNLGYTL